MFVLVMLQGSVTWLRFTSIGGRGGMGVGWDGRWEREKNTSDAKIVRFIDRLERIQTLSDKCQKKRRRKKGEKTKKKVILQKNKKTCATFEKKKKSRCAS